MLIREEEPRDGEQVARVHASAFGGHGSVVIPLVDDLRRSLPTEGGLSLVACDGDDVVGHVLFTHNLLDAPRRLVDVQVLSPLGVLTSFQQRGVGTSLVEHGLAILDERGTPAVFLEGLPAYYPRFGFRPGGELGFRKPSLRIPDAAFLVRLLPAYEPWMTGTLVYRHTFWEHDAVGLRESPKPAPTPEVRPD